MQNGMLPDTLFKLGGFMSFSDNNCYLELESVTAPFAGISLGLFPAQSTSGEFLV